MIALRSVPKLLEPDHAAAVAVPLTLLALGLHISAVLEHRCTHQCSVDTACAGSTHQCSGTTGMMVKSHFAHRVATCKPMSCW